MRMHSVDYDEFKLKEVKKLVNEYSEDLVSV